MVSEDVQQILDIKVKYEDAIYGIIRFQEKLNELTRTQKQMDEQLEKGEITWNEWATQTEAAAAATKQYKDNIRVHVISPGGVFTPMIAKARPDLTPEGMMLPEDIASVVGFYLEMRLSNAVVDEIQLHRVNKEPFA